MEVLNLICAVLFWLMVPFVVMGLIFAPFALLMLLAEAVIKRVQSWRQRAHD